MHACEMTLAYLRGGLSTCSMVWVEFEYFSLKFIQILMQLCKTFLSNFKKLRLIPSFSGALYACTTLFLKSASVPLVCDFEVWCKNDDFSRDFVNFKQFDFLNPYTFR